MGTFTEYSMERVGFRTGLTLQKAQRNVIVIEYDCCSLLIVSNEYSIG